MERGSSLHGARELAAWGEGTEGARCMERGSSLHGARELAAWRAVVHPVVHSLVLSLVLSLVHPFRGGGSVCESVGIRAGSSVWCVHRHLGRVGAQMITRV
jgi:hypothetical protein